MPVAPEEEEFQEFLRETIPKVDSFDELYYAFIRTPFPYIIPDAFYLLELNWQAYQEDKRY